MTPPRFTSLSATKLLAAAALTLSSAAVLVPAAVSAQNAPGQSQAQTQAQPRNAVLVADSLRLEGRQLLIASGRVEAYYDGIRLQASRVIYDRRKNQLRIEGPIVLDDGRETVVLADSAELDPRLENGLMLGARMIMDQRVQLAANQINRIGGRYSQLYKVAATSCRVCDSTTPPLWQIRAQETIHDAEARQLYFKNAQLRVLDVPIFWLPRLRLPDPTLDRASGFLIPSLKQNSQLGLGLKLPYFIRMGDHRDLTLTPYLSRNTRTLELRYRQAFHSGRMEFKGALSDDSLTTNTRGYLFGQGRFDLPRDYVLDLQVEAVSDRSYLVDYDYSDNDRLESEVALTRVKRNEYTRFALTSYQTLREGEDNSTLPTIIGAMQYEKRYHPKALGGEVIASAGLNTHYRYSDLDIVGRDVTRADASLNWRRSWTLPAGIRAEYSLGVAADGFLIGQDSSSVSQTGQVTPQTHLALRWPMMKTGANATHVLEPMAMLGWVGGSNANVPNEESTRVEFDEGNLLDLSRFPATDRRERGTQAALGLRWSRLAASGNSANLVFGQVYRQTRQADFSDTSGLSGTVSDVLLAGQYRTASGFSFSARALLDNGFDANKAEARAEWQTDWAGLSGSYVWLGMDAAEGRASTVSEWLLDGHYRFSRHWIGSAAGRYDVAADKLAEAKLGLAYRNECVDVKLSLSRRFTSSTIVEPSTTLDFTVNLTGFNAAKFDNSYTRSCRK